MLSIREFMDVYDCDNPNVNDEFKNRVVTLVEKLQTYEYRISQNKTRQFIDDYFDELFPRRVEHREGFLPWKCYWDRSFEYCLPMIEYYYMVYDEWKGKGEKTSPDAYAHLYVMQCYNCLANIPYSRQEIPHKDVTDVELRLFIKRIMQPQTETAKSINRDNFLFGLFKNNEAVYDKFFEQCDGKTKIDVVIELIAVTIVLYGEKDYLSHLLKENDRTALYKILSKYFQLADLATFNKTLESFNAMPEARKRKINKSKIIYQNILDEKL